MALALFLFCLLIHSFDTTDQTSAPAPLVFDDFPGLGRMFDGIGGLSAGASSKLLINYPEEQRNQVLDYMFKPNFGASLQILKVEIGGDVQSTDGTEASHMHNSWEENYERGYEWWLMKEAKKRNPDIKLYGLPWGFPGWVGNGTGSPYTNISATVDYIVKWISGAKTKYNLTIDYIGIWNEHAYDVQCIKLLRRTLDQQGFQNVLMIMTDDKWEIVTEIQKDAALASAIFAIGCHYPGTYSSVEGVKTGIQLWSSEDFSTVNDEVGGGCWARILNQNYVNGLMTSTITWSLIGSFYEGLIFYSVGLMTAAQPWSGSYEVQTPIWLTAHTTQFTSPGWQYLSHGSGVGKLPHGGSYVALVSPERDQLSIIIETMTHDHSLCIRPALQPYSVQPQQVTIALKGSFANITQMNMWYSKLGFGGNESIMFEKKESIKFENGQATLSLGLDEVFTLTTVTSGQKGMYPPPPPAQPFPLPYKDDFEDYDLYQEPSNLAQQMGSFEVLSSGQNKFIRQMVLEPPVLWCYTPHLNKSYSIIGNSTWSDVLVEIDFEIPDVNGTDGVFIAARAVGSSCHGSTAQGIFFFVLPDKFVVTHDLARRFELAHGPISYASGWHKLSLLVQGGVASGALDKKGIFNITAPSKPAAGWVAIGTDSYGLADFDNLSIALARDGSTKMTHYFEYSPLYFAPEQV